MKQIFTSILALFLSISGISQIVDTVYFDDNGHVYIEEFSSHYRITKFDTISGEIIGEFKDYNRLNDSLVATGEYSTSEGAPQIINFEGNSMFQPIAQEMLNLKASYVRIRDYPVLREFIQPNQSMKERTEMTSEYGDFVIVEQTAEFIGGFEALGWFLNQFLEYPEEAFEKKISGTVRVEFAIDIDGSVTDIRIVEGIGYGCDKEVVRVMNLIPDWLPAIQHGRFVKTTFTLPIPFS